MIISRLGIVALFRLGICARVYNRGDIHEVGNFQNVTPAVIPAKTPTASCQPNSCLAAVQAITNAPQLCLGYLQQQSRSDEKREYIESNPCDDSSASVSSACSCILLGLGSCPPAVTITIPGVGYTTTENFTTTIWKPTTIIFNDTITTTYISKTTVEEVSTTDVYTTVTDDVYHNVTETDLATTTKAVYTTVTDDVYHNVTETDLATTTKAVYTTVTDDVYHNVTETDLATTTKEATVTENKTIIATATYDTTFTADVTVPTTVTQISVSEVNSFITGTVTDIVPTTVISISEVVSFITTSYPVTTMAYSYITTTDLATGPPVIFTSFVTQVSYITTVLTSSYFTTATQTATQTVPNYISVTETDISSVTAPAQTVTLPGVVSVQTIVTTLPGGLTTITAAGSTVVTTVSGKVATVTAAGSTIVSTLPGGLTTITLPGVISVQTIVTNLPGGLTTITAAGSTVVTTVSGKVATVTAAGSTIVSTLPGGLTTITAAGSTVVTTVSGKVATITAAGSTIVSTLPGGLTTITLPGVISVQTIVTNLPGGLTTITLPGVISVQTIVTTLPGGLTTVTAPGGTTIVTLPAVTSTITTTITLAGATTVLGSTVPGPTISGPAITVTETKSASSVVTCPNPTPTFIPAVKPPNDYTWGCAPGFVCHPPKPAGCDVFAGPPPDDYVCQPSECIPSPEFTRPTNWGSDYKSNITSFYPPQPDYFNLSPFAFGLSYDIFTEEVDTIVVTGPDGKQTTSTITTGNWASQTSITSQPTIIPTGLLNNKAKRAIFRRDISTVPSMCFNECNNCYIEAQQIGKSPELCATNPPSTFQEDYTACQLCVQTYGDPTQTSLKSYVVPEFQQFLSFCQGTPAESQVVGPSTAPASQVSGPGATPPVSVQSQQAPNSATGVAPLPPNSSGNVQQSAAVPTPTPPNSAIPASTTSNPAGSASSSAPVQFQGSGSSLYPAGLFSSVLVSVIITILSFLA